MANPIYVGLPLIFVSRPALQFELQILTPPTGIWRQTGRIQHFQNGPDATREALAHQAATGGIMALTFEAAQALAILNAADQ